MPKVIYIRNFGGTNTKKIRVLNSLAAVEILDDYILIQSCMKVYDSHHIQGDSRLVDITAGGDFLGLCDQKS